MRFSFWVFMSIAAIGFTLIGVTAAIVIPIQMTEQKAMEKGYIEKVDRATSYGSSDVTIWVKDSK